MPIDLLTQIITALLAVQIAMAQAGGTYSTTTVESMAHWTAKVYGLNEEHFVETIRCESGFDGMTQSFILDPSGPNGHEDSWGVAQIYLPAHPEITREEAQDVAFSLQWMAQAWQDDRANLWSCWKQKYGA